MISGPLKALLGVLAVAGYQNGDKIGELLRGIQAGRNPGGAPGQTDQQPGGLGGLLGGLAGGQGGLGDLLGGILSGGLGDLLKTFQQNGHGDKAESWVRPGPNADIDHGELAQAIGPEILDELAAKTGLPREEILGRLRQDLPKAVDDLTPNGTLPESDEGFGHSRPTAV
jgi:uncharacterized protein YidB (DUF937 family)